MPTLNHKAALGQSLLSDSGKDIQSFTTKSTKKIKSIIFRYFTGTCL